MSLKPILFNGEMVRAVIENRKSQTRRVIKEQPDYPARYDGMGFESNDAEFHYWEKLDGDGNGAEEYRNFGKCPFGRIGDKLWIRETFLVWCGEYYYRADENSNDDEIQGIVEAAGGWKPSIFMPYTHSRLTLEITDVRVEKLQDISQSDAENEGINLNEFNCFENYMAHTDWIYDGKNRKGDMYCLENPVMSFASLWDSINLKRGFGWNENPFVWVVEFKKI